MSYYTITARGPSVAEIRIDGPIGESFFEETITARSFTAELAKVKAETLNLYLNSPGGSVMDANVIYAALKRHPAKVHCVVDGWALSAASLIAMAGDTISIGQRSLMMIHNPRTVAAGDAPALRKSAEVLDKIKTGMVDTYRVRLNLEPEQVAALLDAETWYSASEAVSAGLADTVIPDSAAPARLPEKIRNQFSFIPAAYAVYAQESEMTEVTREAPPVVEELPTPSEPDAAPVEAESVATLTVRVSESIDISAHVAAGIKADRERVKSIRAAFAPWLKRGYDLTALQMQCEDDGLDVPTVNARLLAALGGMAEPLASVTQGQAESPVNPLDDAVATYRTAHPAATEHQARAAVLQEQPSLYDAWQASRKGA